MASNPDDYSQYDLFEIFDCTYKVVSGHSIGCSVLVPKTLLAKMKLVGPRPLMMRFHAGGWIAASRLFPNYFSPWQLALAARHSALIVTPDYRMLPESSLDELMEDIEDFWNWVQTELPGFVRN
ncbi:unnamed protein product [Clonostachys solani]|uniref:Alpha/beta hydrolase fold-3 domain-containing protein n=1 Tax=Clonostachys solani TaxID=160281 RepID=A0A9N9W1K1_9HYPO|nr:unnamed protein product [Clonostachys solani]